MRMIVAVRAGKGCHGRAVYGAEVTPFVAPLDVGCTAEYRWKPVGPSSVVTYSRLRVRLPAGCSWSKSSATDVRQAWYQTNTSDIVQAWLGDVLAIVIVVIDSC